MRLLGANKINYGLIPLSIEVDENFKTYHKKPWSIVKNGKEAVFVFSKPPKYRYVTVPKGMKYEKIWVTGGQKSGMLDCSMMLKDGDEVNVIDFGKMKARVK